MMLKALILSGEGINTEYEMAHAVKTVGGVVNIIHVNTLIKNKKILHDYNLLIFPGGFSFGDELGSGKVLAGIFSDEMWNELMTFISQRKLILGVCNGFQVLVKMGLLPDLSGYQKATLTYNDSGRFEDRWVYLKINPLSPCVFTKGIDSLYLPVRHGEGKFITDEKTLGYIAEKNLYAMQYVDEKGNLAGYPYNPNGSIMNIAGICDESGQVFGLMPHPEAYTHFTNHPRWTRLEGLLKPNGLSIFENAKKYVEGRL
jgi:phosphoribosylformylglycinamidine synthase I